MSLTPRLLAVFGLSFLPGIVQAADVAVSGSSTLPRGLTSSFQVSVKFENLPQTNNPCPATDTYANFIQNRAVINFDTENPLKYDSTSTTANYYIDPTSVINGTCSTSGSANEYDITFTVTETSTGQSKSALSTYLNAS